MAWIGLLLLQLGLDAELLRHEDARAGTDELVAALASDDTSIVLQAVRALGRFERPELGAEIAPLLGSDSADVRVAAAFALGQMGDGAEDLRERIDVETEPRVLAAVYESLARASDTDADEETLLNALSEPAPAGLGALRGLEYGWRTRERSPGESALSPLRALVTASSPVETTELALLALNRASDRHVETLEAAWRHPDPLVRRLALIGLGEHRPDPSPIVRYDALRQSPTCEHALDALEDESEHVVLLAIDSLGEGCAPEPLRSLVRRGDGWRRRVHALVSLAKVAPDQATAMLEPFLSHPVWQARVYAARAAKVLRNERALETLRRDEDPNVVAAALVDADHALEVLGDERHTHYGLLVTALGLLEEATLGADELPVLLSRLRSVTRDARATSRDPRRLLLERIDASETRGPVDLDYLLDDLDPFIAARAAEVSTRKNGTRVSPTTERFAPGRMPSAEELDALDGARVRIRMKEAGELVLELYPETAPFTCAQFVRLAESGYYDGLTFHRVVPNFVLQGGSPGANEFVGTPEYIRDEVSARSHLRGTLGISTRGRDTGDSQIFINLVDNFRLDRSYTVFAKVIEGMDAVDRVVEGDVMESVTVVRR